MKNIKIIPELSLFLLLISLCSYLTFAQQPPQQEPQQQVSQQPPAAFGYDIFRALPEPITEGPVDEEYLISPGDEIIVAVWGQLNLKHVLTVSEDGYVELPDEGGRVFTNGASLRELKRLITESLSRIYSSYINIGNPGASTAFVDVKLGKVRKLLVYVMGEVKSQGTYTISSAVATILNLLNNAGGVKEIGSLREIKLRRADGTVDTVDLYDLLITGKMDTKKNRVKYGDYIIVPLKAKSATIKGEVKRPGIYEMVGKEGLRDLMRFAGGLTSNAYLNRAQIRRYEVNAGEKFIDLDLEKIVSDPGQDFGLVDGDEVTIFPNIVVRRRMVEIQGKGIKRPGIYQFIPGMTVRDLIEQAEGLKEEVYLDRADLVRTAEDFSKKLTIFSLKDLYKEERPGYYVFTGNAEKNFNLKELDQVMTYSSYEITGKDKFVILEGHVKEPGKYVLPENMTLYDLVFSRGGFQDEDFKKRAYLELAHVFRKTPGELEEKIYTFNLGKLLEGDAAENMKLDPSDRVVIYSYESLEKKPFVTIEGLVNRPGVYPLAADMTLEDLILVAGGLRPDAYKVEAVIARIGREIERDRESGEAAQGAKTKRAVATIVVPVEADFAVLPDEKKTPLQISDKIVIRNLPDWEPLPVVSVEGQVVFPGSYSLESRVERISSVIRRAGGLKESALAEGAMLTRRKDIIEMMRERREETERIAINLKGALESPGGGDDLVLRDGDLIYVPYNPGTVEVKGEVRNPAIFQHRSGKGLDYYIELAGGYALEADKGGVVVYFPNGAAARKKIGLFRGRGVPAGSVIEVPAKEKAAKIEFVEVRGAVKKPVMVQWKKGEKLDYYVGLCGGYREDADKGNMIVHAADGKVVEGRGMESFNPSVGPGSVIEIPFVKEKKEEGAGDVEVKGAVGNPGLVRFRKGEKLEYYIDFCGGYAANADAENVVVRLPDGTKLERKGAAVFDPVIVAGSAIEVPVKETKK
jgi:protein involved in polysaccharide export with SLBB domain